MPPRRKQKAAPPPNRPEVIKFLQAIKENPEDDAPRLMLADWLTEHGDPRGEFVRIQVELAHLPKRPVARKLEKREEALETAHRKSWLGPLPKSPRAYSFHRGLIQVDFAQWKAFFNSPLAKWAGTETIAWVDSVILNQTIPATAVPNVAKSPLLAGLNELCLPAAQSDALVKALARSPGIQQLTRLVINGISLRAAEQLAASPYLGRLSDLMVGRGSLNATGATALVASTSLSNLRILALPWNQLGDEGLQQIARLAGLARLHTLDLSDNQLTDTGVQALARSRHAGNLRWLDLSENPLSEVGVTALALSPHLQQLEDLDLRGIQAPKRVVQQIFGKRFGTVVRA